MAERLEKCPLCNSIFVDTVKILNPATINMNANAELQCSECQHQWQGKVTSPYYKKLRKKDVKYKKENYAYSM